MRRKVENEKWQRLFYDTSQENNKISRSQNDEFQQKLDRTMYIVGWISIVTTFFYAFISKQFDFHITKFEPPCLFHFITGYYCPGCGGTRSVILFMQGHFIRSFIYYPLVPYTVVVGGIFMIRMTITYFTKEKIRPMHMKMAYFMVALGILILNFVIKNVCLYYGLDLLPNL